MPFKSVVMNVLVTDSHITRQDGVVIDSGSADTTLAQNYTSATETVPDYRERIADGRNATGHMVASGVSRKFEPLYSSVIYVEDPDGDNRFMESSRTGLQGIPIGASAFDNLMGNAANQARMKLYKRAIAERRKLQGGVIIGEIKQTMAMLTNPAKALRQTLEHYHDNVRRKAKRSRGTSPEKMEAMVRDTYLEATFGWGPLLNDTKAAAEALAANYEKLKREIKTFRATHSEEQKVVGAQGVVTIGPHRWFFVPFSKRVDTCKLLGQQSSNASSPMLRTTRELGFSPYDFVPTIYNLVPWSFVLDYFTNTGDVLDAWSARDIVWDWGQETQISRVLSDRTVMDDSMTWIAELGHKPTGATFVPGRNEKDSWSISRVILEESYGLLPKFQFEIPGVRQNFNMAALAGKFASLTKLLGKLVK